MKKTLPLFCALLLAGALSGPADIDLPWEKTDRAEALKAALI